MKQRWLILLMILLLLSGCTPGRGLTVPHSERESSLFYQGSSLFSEVDITGTFGEKYTNFIIYQSDENGHAYLAGPFGAKESENQTSERETIPPTLPEESSTQPPATETLPTAASEETTESRGYYTPEPHFETLIDIRETLADPAEVETTAQQETTTEQETTASTSSAPAVVYYNGKTWTWIDVDISAQMVYVYQGGACIASFPCVTGSVIDGWATPTGTYSIQSKQRNRMLNGRSFVKYWMPFFRDYGLHDAAWRDGNFRADQAWSYGSHGCVNLPEEGAKFIWDNCSVGDMVIVRGTAPNPGPHTSHDLSGEWEVEKEPTCTEAGKKFKLCPACHGIASSQVLPAKGHNWDLSSDGKTQTCKTCKASEKVEETWSVTMDWYLIQEGKWGEWKIGTPATTEQPGEKYREKTDQWARDLESSYGNTKTETEERIERETEVIPKLPTPTTTAVPETTSAPPTTVAPTTAPPTTAAPTTAAPTTAPPTTAPPTTAAPTTAEEITTAPTTTETTPEISTTPAPTTEIIPAPTTTEEATTTLPETPPEETTVESTTAAPPAEPPTKPSSPDETLPDPSETGGSD